MSIKLVTVSKDDRRVFLDGGDLAEGAREAVTLLSTNVDSGSSPTTLLRPGNVLGKDSAGKYVEANDTNVVADTVASHTGTGAAFSTGSLTFIWQYKGGAAQTVTGAGGDDTLAEWVIKLNADADFAADLVASDSGSQLKIASKRAGADEYFTIGAGTVNTEAGVTAGSYGGGDGEYRVLTDYVDMLDANAVASDQPGSPVVWRGYFDESNLINLTAVAKASLLRAGSKFA